MNQTNFIGVVKQFPQVWDRNCATFREQSLKNEAWQHIGDIMNCSAATSKDTFKSLREKYVREKEKQTMFGDKYMPWQHLESLSFLDPHIILRKQSLNFDTEATKTENKLNMSDESFFAQVAENYSDFDKTLIALVKKAGPIWDRRSNGCSSKQVKFQLWRGISQAMNKDVSVCMMRWKALREKYIRQKNKYQEGDGKWEFLDGMSFLDKVIQYRRKPCEPNTVLPYRPHIAMAPEPNFQFHRSSNEIYDDNSIHDSSSNDFTPAVKREDFSCDNQDSSYDSGRASSGRKRSASDNSESSHEKREKVEDVTQKSPEAMFGELVAAMLAKKTERDKNIAMIEIMKVLTK